MAVGSIVIDLLARTASFQTDLNRASKELAKFKRDAVNAGRDAASAFKDFAATLGVGLSVAGITALVKSSIDAADHLNDLSQKTGIAVATLGGIGYAAEQAGGTLDSAAAGIGKLNKTLAAAAAGNKDAGEAFKLMGISVTDASGQIRAADDVLAEVADRFSEYEDGPNKAALALRIFGKAGADMIPQLNEGGDALRQNIAYYKQFSGINEEAAARADQFNDTMAKLKLLLDGFVTNVVGRLMPTLQAIADHLVQAGEKGGGFEAVAKGLNTTLQTMAVLGANVAFVIRGITNEFNALVEQAGALGVGAGDMAKGPAGILAAMGKAAISGKMDLGKFRQVNKDAIEEAKKQRAELDKFEQQVMGNGPSQAAFESGYVGQGIVKPPKGKGAPGLSDSDAASKAEAELRKRLDGQVKAIQDFGRQQADAYAFANQFVEGQRDAGLISLQQHFDEQDRIRQDALAAQLDAIDKEVDAYRVAASKTSGAGRIELENKIAEAVAKRADVEADAGRKNILTTQQQNRELQQTLSAYDDLRAQVMENAGNTFGAAKIRNSKLVSSARETVTAAGGDPAIVDRYSAQIDGQAKLSEAQKKYNELLDRTRNSEEDILRAAERGEATEEATLKSLGKIRQDALLQMRGMVTAANDLVAAQKQAFGGVATPEAIKNAEELGLAYKRAADAANPALDEMRAKALQAQRGIHDALGDSLEQALTGKFDGILKSWGSMLLQMVNKAIAADVLSAITGGKSGAGGNTSSLWSGIAGLFGAAAGSSSGFTGAPGQSSVDWGMVPQYATGTDYVPRDMLAMVHEGERITPKAFNPAIGGGAANVQIVNNGAPATATATQERGPDGRQLLKITLAAMKQDIAAGGQVAKAMESQYGLRRNLPRRA